LTILQLIFSEKTACNEIFFNDSHEKEKNLLDFFYFQKTVAHFYLTHQLACGSLYDIV